MRIILLQDIKGLGRANDLVSVSDGYARNSLIPRGLAVLADEKGLAIKRDIDEAKQRSKEAITSTAKKLSNIDLEFTLKTGDKGEAYGSISKKDIEKALYDKGLKDFKVKLNKPLKLPGEHLVEVGLSYGLSTKVRLRIN